MQTRIYDTRTVTAEEQCSVHDDAAIAIVEDRIGCAACRRLFEGRPERQPPPGLNWVQ